MAGYGFHRDIGNSELDIQVAGTQVFAASATNVTFPTNVTLDHTLTAGDGTVGSDGEQLTSGGAGADTDWAAAGSMRVFKNVGNERTDTAKALKILVSTPVYDFKYKTKEQSSGHVISTGDFKTTYTGIMADDAPWAMHHSGKILNLTNTFGYTVLAIKELLSRIEKLEVELKELR